MRMRIGIDLGGTKIEAIVLDGTGGITFRERRATPRGDYDATIDAIAALVEAAERSVESRCSVGIGMPGAISPATGVVKNANSTWLNGRRLHEDLEARLSRPVRLANDANCFALSEASDGAGAGAETVFGVILGTGCGGGVVVRGGVLTGPNAVAGEWGHNPLPWPRDDERPGPSCYCGKHGCLETFVSGTGLALDYQTHTGSRITAADVVARATAGEAAAQSALDRYANRLARGLATVVNLLDPDVIVLGGGMSNAAALYATVPAHLPEYVFSDRVTTRVVPPTHGDSSGVRGAAWLWPADRL
jgi:fructokinase